MAPTKRGVGVDAETGSAGKVDRTTLGEVLGYAGVGAATTALGLLLVGNGSGDEGKNALVAGVAAVGLLAVGVALGNAKVGGANRFRSVMWFLSVVAGYTALQSIFLDAGQSGKAAAIASGALTAIYAGGLWWFSTSTLQQLACYLTLVSAVVAAVFPDTSDPTFTGSVGVVTAVLLVAGSVWIALGAAGYIRPRRAAWVIGAISLSIAPLFASDGADETGPVLLLAAVGLLAFGAGTLLDDRAISGIGIVDLLFSGSAAAASFAQGSKGNASAALVIALAMLVGSVLLLRQVDTRTVAQRPDALDPPPQDPAPPPPPPDPSEG
jgi:hypothetical protein